MYCEYECRRAYLVIDFRPNYLALRFSKNVFAINSDYGHLLLPVCLFWEFAKIFKRENEQDWK